MYQEKKVVLVTGASSGIGEAIAMYLAKKNYIVYGTSRKENTKISDFTFLQMDLNNSLSVEKAVQKIISEQGRLDILINNAGIGMAGPVEETLDSEISYIFDTNLTGIARVCRTVLPHMRKQASGKIINISSIAGQIGLPYRAFYCASKFALEGFSEALSMEVKRFGIKVCLIQPGDMKTNINQSRVEVESTLDSPYRDSYSYVKKLFNRAVSEAKDPIVIAKLVDKIILAKNPKFRYKIGSFFEWFTFIVKKTVPFRWFETFVNTYYKMNK